MRRGLRALAGIMLAVLAIVAAGAGCGSSTSAPSGPTPQATAAGQAVTSEMRKSFEKKVEESKAARKVAITKKR